MTSLLSRFKRTTTKTNNFDVINPMLKNKSPPISEKNFFNTFSSFNENPDIKDKDF